MTPQILELAKTEQELALAMMDSASALSAASCAHMQALLNWQAAKHALEKASVEFAMQNVKPVGGAQ